MEDIYSLKFSQISRLIGEGIKKERLTQNITQQDMSDQINVSVSSIKKIEKGEIRSFDSLVRLLRTLGKLDVLQPLVEEDQLSPSEYYQLVQSTKAHQRKRAAGQININNKEESEW